MFPLSNIHFVHPSLFILLIAIPLFALRYFLRRKKEYPDMRVSSLQAFKGSSSIKGKLRILLPILRALGFAAMVFALARPQLPLKEENITAEGIDIILVTDVSSSMLARDFQPDRLEASKEVALDFIEKREFDRIGLCVFAGEAFTQCPLTTDHKILSDFLFALRCGILKDGTAIGLGLASAINRLKESEAKSKVVILLTDGVNNAGEYMMPLTAAEIAREFKVKVYTIGVGTTGDAYAPVGRKGNGEYVFGHVRVEIDEQLLKQIATMTGGQYFRAVNRQSLENIYATIDELEKSEIDVTSIKRYSEEYYRFLFLGLLFLLLEFLLRHSYFRSIP